MTLYNFKVDGIFFPCPYVEIGGCIQYFNFILLMSALLINA